MAMILSRYGCAFGACSDIYPPEVPAPPGAPAPYVPPSISLSVPGAPVPVPGAPAPVPGEELYPDRRGLPWWAWLAIGIVLARAFGRS